MAEHGAVFLAALEFEDRRQANLLLQSVKAEKDIVAVSVYDRQRHFFAGFAAPDAALKPPRELPNLAPGQSLQPGLNFQLHTIEHTAPIRLHDEVVGYIHVQARADRLLDQWMVSLALILGVSVLSGWLALRGAARLQRRIVEPIVQLARSIRRLTREQDFEVRVESNAQDEIGQLTRGFNDMLTHLQERELTLADRNQALELAAREATLARESAEQALRFKSMFLANMSHEIRTPMNGILGITEILLESRLNAQQKEHVGTVLHSGRALLNIINDILDFSKIEAGKLVLTPSSFALSVFFQELLDLFAQQARQQGLKLSLQVDPAVPEWIWADAGRLRQILANLVGNAIKFTPSGSVILRVRAAAAQRPSLALVFEVIDTGIGISDAQHSQIFEEFNQGDSSAARRHGGTGLGLSIALRLARLMNGSMALQSRQGHGSTFTLNILAAVGMVPASQSPEPQAYPLRLPVLAVPGPALASTHTADGDQTLGWRRCRVLVVEDNLVNQIVVQAALERAGCQVGMADGGAAGVRAATQDHYDLVLMDCQMPEVDGYEATRQIREWESAQPAARRLPIIALTAHAMAGDREKCEAAGMDDYLTKPMSAKELMSVLSRWLTPTGSSARQGTAETR